MSVALASISDSFVAPSNSTAAALENHAEARGNDFLTPTPCSYIAPGKYKLTSNCNLLAAVYSTKISTELWRWSALPLPEGTLL